MNGTEWTEPGQVLEFTNQWGGNDTACQEHELTLRKGLLGGLTAVLTDKPCRICREAKRASDYAAALPGLIREALLDQKFSHSRFRRWCGVGIVYIYHRDATSPSGVLLVAGAEESIFEAVYAEQIACGGIRSSAAPLSPTEGLR